MPGCTFTDFSVLTVPLPAFPAGTQDLRMKPDLHGYTYNASWSQLHFQATQELRLVSITPDTGRAEGGQYVTLIGAGFSAEGQFENIVQFRTLDTLQCDETMTGLRGSGYQGCQSHTRSDRPCQNGAFCRNDGAEKDTIWCNYEEDGNIDWEYCDVLPQQLCLVQEANHTHLECITPQNTAGLDAAIAGLSVVVGLLDFEIQHMHYSCVGASEPIDRFVDADACFEICMSLFAHGDCTHFNAGTGFNAGICEIVKSCEEIEERDDFDIYKIVDLNSVGSVATNSTGTRWRRNTENRRRDGYVMSYAFEDGQTGSLNASDCESMCYEYVPPFTVEGVTPLEGTYGDELTIVGTFVGTDVLDVVLGVGMDPALSYQCEIQNRSADQATRMFQRIFGGVCGF